jgi:TPR repeat protein
MQQRLGLMVLMGCGVLSLLVGRAFPTPTDEAFKRGVDAYKRQDYTTALREWQPLAQHGYHAAQTNLGHMYAQGRGVARNDTEAVKWYRKAAAQGNALAQASLGDMYLEGRGVRQDVTEGAFWYGKALAQGYVGGQASPVARYDQGRGVAQNDAEAVKRSRKAADQGNAQGQYNLGLKYERGQGIPQDLVAAQRLFAQAAEAFPPGAKRDKALQARDRVARQLAAAPVSPPQPAPTPSAVSPMTPSTSSPPAVSSTPSAQSRRALVIGNAAYPDSPLTNPVNDATDLATLLSRLGFDVTLHRDADKPTMEKAIDLFTQGAPRGSAGLFFFAGHGVQIDGVNYLVPIGARFSAASDVKYHTVAADWVLARMDESGMDVKLLLLDACRDNPLGRSWTRALSRGLAVMETPKGALIAYATSPGKTASDGTGRNSPFTVQLLRELVIAGRDIEVALKAVRAGVQQTTKGEQIPWVASSMTGDFYIGLSDSSREIVGVKEKKH